MGPLKRDRAAGRESMLKFCLGRIPTRDVRSEWGRGTKVLWKDDPGREGPLTEHPGKGLRRERVRRERVLEKGGRGEKVC